MASTAIPKEFGSIAGHQKVPLNLLKIIERDSLNQVPLYNIYSDLVYATKAADVETVIINSRLVMQWRRLLTLNEAAIKRDAGVFRERIIKSLAPQTENK